MLTDSFGRSLNYLRISVTDRCNLRCRYCMPEEGIKLLSHEDILSFDEIIRITEILSSLGINRIRLTGGEPLVRRDIDVLARRIKKIPGIDFLGLTTNGVLLEECAQSLKDAGTDGINISIDTVDPKRYEEITRRNELHSVLRGLDKALKTGFQSVKINCVLDPDSRTEDWLNVCALAKDLPADVRLIEWMPIARSKDKEAVSAGEALKTIAAAFGELQPHERTLGAGPARYYSIAGFKGRIGIIDAMSHSFCSECTRLRLSASGSLRFCLFYDTGIALKPLIRSGITDEKLADILLQAVKDKPEKHQGRKEREDKINSPLIESSCGMYDLGG